ncbi:hypothetical protein NHJ13734_007871 [Beauveria thailandica]
MASSLTEKGDSLATSHADPVSHTKPVEDTEKAEASKVTQHVIETGCSGIGNDTDSSAGLERWNGSRNNTARFLVVNLALFIMGMNDACLGIEPYYNVNYTQVSTLFAVPFVGYVAAALSNNWIHFKFGQRGVAFIGPICRIVGYLPMALHPPFPVLPVALLVAGYGNGIEDSGYNAWVGNMHQANELLGLIHGAYGLGATISPLIASAMVAKGHLQWYTFYYVMIVMVGCEFALGMRAFWPHDGASYRIRLAYDNEGKERITTRHVLKQPLTWVVAVFLLGYVGVEVSLGGWIPTFMIKVRHAEPFLAGLSVTLFWLGLTLGRVILGFVTGRIGEKLAITVYIILSIALQLLYWLVPNFAASLVFIILLGFFLGPLFPAAIVTATKLLPPEYHVSAIGFAGGFGGGGAAIIPFGVGAMAQRKGVSVLQPIVLAFLIFDLIGWLIMPGGFKKGGLRKAREEKTPVGGDFVQAGRWLAGKLLCQTYSLASRYTIVIELVQSLSQQDSSRSSITTHIAQPYPVLKSGFETGMQPTSGRSTTSAAQIVALAPLKPDLCERAWQTVAHPTLPLIATVHGKGVTVFSLATLLSHSSLTGGHTRSVRSVAWKPNLSPHKLCLVSGSFDATAGVWRWDGDQAGDGGAALEREVTSAHTRNGNDGNDDDDDDDGKSQNPDSVEDKEWEFTLVLEGHDSEIKSCAFSPSGAHLATCSRDKSVWIWEDIGASEEDDEWETIAVLNEHEGDVKAVSWCPDVPGRNARRRYSPDVLASASYDNTARIWREDNDGEWVCVAVLEGHEQTVWGVQWESRPRPGDKFPRLLSFSADATIRIWTLKEDEEGDDGEQGSRSALGGIPNTMRRSLREEWVCTAVLPAAHHRDIYAVAWSAQTGVVASTGSDGKIVLYKEDFEAESPTTTVAAGPDSDQPMTDGTEEQSLAVQQPPSALSGSARWSIIGTKENAHGPYEVNHIVWCKRYDGGASARGEEEMLITTGDDGIVQPWEIILNQE